MQFEVLVFQNLIHNESYIRNILPYLKENYFTQSSHKTIYNLIVNYFNKYNNNPNISAIKIELDDQSINTEEYKECIDILKSIETYNEVEKEWLYEKTEKFCQDKAIYNSIMESIKILDGKSKMDKGSIPTLLQDALSVTFDSNIGHDFLENAEDRYEFYHMKEERIPFDIDFLNTITRGGIPNKTLNCILAGTGVGKSLMMCHMSAANLMQGKNVLYITLEMAEERISERIDANLMNVYLNELETLPKESYLKKLERIKGKTSGKLIVKEYPTSTVGSGHFRHLLNELKTKKNFKPDIIYIDYLNLCISSRMKMGGSINTYTYIKSVAEELRGLAVEFDLPIWTATQSNREGFSNSDVDLTNTSESFGLPATVDFMIAAISTEELEGLGQLLIKQLKNRYGDPSLHKRFVVGVDRARMKLYNVEQNAQDNIGKQIDDKPVMDNSSFGEGLKREKWNKSTFDSWR